MRSINSPLNNQWQLVRLLHKSYEVWAKILNLLLGKSLSLPERFVSLIHTRHWWICWCYVSILLVIEQCAWCDVQVAYSDVVWMEKSPCVCVCGIISWKNWRLYSFFILCACFFLDDAFLWQFLCFSISEINPSQWRCELIPYSQWAHLNVSLWG